MRTHIITPAIASLALFAVNVASASTPAGKPPQNPKVSTSAGAIVSAMSKQWARLYFDEMPKQFPIGDQSHNDAMPSKSFIAFKGHGYACARNGNYSCG